MRSGISVLTVGLMGVWAFGQAPTIDGTADAEYGAALAVQNTSTQFGDANMGLVDFCNGSEADAGYAVIVDGVLYLHIAGNLESNYNHMDIFIDSVPGGQNKLRGDNPDVDFNNLNRMGDDGSGNGLTFDAGFEADFFMTVAGGDVGGGTYGLFSNWAQILTDGGGEGRYLGQGGAVTDGALFGGNNPNGILVTIDNSNTAGVLGGNGLDDGSGVTTGIEIAIPFADLGNPTGDIKVCAFVNGLSHDFLANQVLGGIGGGDNLGEPRNVNFGNIGGDQFFTVSGGGCDSDACNGNETLTIKVRAKGCGCLVKAIVKGGTPDASYGVVTSSGQCVLKAANARGKVVVKECPGVSGTVTVPSCGLSEDATCP